MDGGQVMQSVSQRLKTMNRGGKRKGAGRPALPPGEKKAGVYVKLPPDLITWMDKQSESRAVLIEKALRKTYKIEFFRGEK